MGYIANRFLIVHSWDIETIHAAHTAAVQVFADDAKLVGPVMDGVVNSAPGFIVWTSGSKLGWKHDGQHKARVDELTERLSKLDRPPRWIYVRSGEEDDDFHASRGYDGDYAHRYEVTHAQGEEPEED